MPDVFVPGTIVKLLSGVNLAKDYANTFSWADIGSQTAFFAGKVEGDLVCTDFTYQRENGTNLGTIKFPANAERLQDVNYLMYQNTNFSGRWYYAFIDSVEYINPGMSLIHFKIDSWQTYYWDLTWRNCLVTRKHVANDAVGVSRLDEDIDVGTLHELSSLETDLGDHVYMTAVTSTPTGGQIAGAIQTGVYSGLQFQAWKTAAALDAFIQSYVTGNNPESIQAIFTIPEILIFGSFNDGDIISQPDCTFATKSITPKVSGDIFGYTPRNKKCYQFPYNYLEITNGRGAKSVYAYEDFEIENDLISFYVRGNIGVNPTIYMIPYEYKGSNVNPTEAISLSDYPLCAWSYDAYRAWLTQNPVTNALSLAGGAISIGTGVAAKSPIAIASGVMGFAQTLGNFYEKTLDPNPMKGSPSGSAAIAAGLQTFRLAKKACTRERIEIIDNYFHMYGYKTNTVETPALRTRAYWNYIQCGAVNVFGAFPTSNLQEIRDSLMRGITFWHDDNVGDYSRSNP